MGTDLQTVQPAQAPAEAVPSQKKLLTKMAAAYGLEEKAFLATMKTTIFPLAETNEQLITLLVVADQYGLNPFLKGELHAFPQAGGVVPIVGVDGWHKIANRQPALQGWTLEWSDKMVKAQGANAPCPESWEITIYRNDRQYPVVVREWLDEVYRGTAPWKSHPKRMLRHKTLIQGFREAFGISGIYDPDEAERIVEGEVVEATASAPQPTNADRVRAAIGEGTVDVTITATDHASPALAEAAAVELGDASGDMS